MLLCGFHEDFRAFFGLCVGFKKVFSGSYGVLAGVFSKGRRAPLGLCVGVGARNDVGACRLYYRAVLGARA